MCFGAQDIDEPLPPSKSELSPEEAAPICKYTGSAWCPPGTTNAGEKYRRGKEAFCCKIEARLESGHLKSDSGKLAKEKKEEKLSTPSVPMQPILADTKQEAPVLCFHFLSVFAQQGTSLRALQRTKMQMCRCHPPSLQRAV